MESKASRLWEHQVSPRILWFLLQFKYTYVVGLYKFKDFLRNESPVVVRMILGFASVLFSASLIAQPGTFDRPGFIHLRNFLGAWDAPTRVAEYVWASGFAVHTLGLILIAVYEPKKDTWPIIINSFGLSLWMTTSLAINWAVKGFSPVVSMEIAVCAFGTWALYTTELGQRPLADDAE